MQLEDEKGLQLVDKTLHVFIFGCTSSVWIYTLSVSLESDL
jgi:hypothetical protein